VVAAVSVVGVSAVVVSEQVQELLAKRERQFVRELVRVRALDLVFVRYGRGFGN
jgi:hypothetical protein